MILLTIGVVILAMNFVTPEKTIERDVTHRYSLSDPQFRREMSVLLGPSVLPGNHVVDIYNHAFAEHMTEVFESDLARARRYSYASWSQRPLRDRLAEKIIWPIRSQL